MRAYDSNILPTDSTSYTLQNATISNDSLVLSAGGSASVTLTTDQLKTLPGYFQLVFVSSVSSYWHSAGICVLIKIVSSSGKYLSYLRNVATPNGLHQYISEIEAIAEDYSTLQVTIKSNVACTLSTWELRPEVNTASAISDEVAAINEDLASFKELTAGNFSAQQATIDTINANYITAAQVDSNYAKITTLQTNYITADQIDTTYVKASVLSSDYITASQIETQFLQADLANIAAGAITNAMIGTGAIGTAQIADNSVTNEKVVSLTAGKLTAGTIDAGTINVINLDCANLTVGAINGNQIAGGAIGTTQLASNAVTSDIIADNAILLANLSAGAITGITDTISIGGRNLVQNSTLLNSAYPTNTTLTSMNSTTSHSFTSDGFYMVTPATGNSNNGYAFMYSDFRALNINPGDTITFSVDIKGTTDANLPFIALHFAGTAATWYETGSIVASKTINVDSTNFKRFFITYTLPDASYFTNYSMWLGIHGNYQASLYVKNLKLEMGNKATDWTAAPEDVDSKITLAQSTADGKNTVFYQASSPATTGRKINDVWFDTDDGYKMYCWDGSTWSAGQLGTNAIADMAITSAKISALDAGKITTGTLDAGRIGANSITIGLLATEVTTAISDASIANWCYSNNTTYIDGAKIFTGTINANSIAVHSITTDQIHAQAISGDYIASDTITANNIVAGAITAREIAAHTITANEIQVNTITAASGVIAEAAITSAMIGSVDAGKITTGTLDAARIAAGSLSADVIDAGSITAESAIIDAIFSKNIYASGTISGVTLIGALLTGSDVAITPHRTSGGVTYMACISTISEIDAVMVPPGYEGDGTLTNYTINIKACKEDESTSSEIKVHGVGTIEMFTTSGVHMHSTLTMYNNLDMGTHWITGLQTVTFSGGGHITNNSNQLMQFAASGESDYIVDLGVVDSMWTFCPDAYNRVALGSPYHIWATVYAANPTINTSDAKDKTDVITLGDSAITFIMALRPVSFMWAEEGHRTHMGCIAQEVATAAVNTIGDVSLYTAACMDKDGNPCDYDASLPDSQKKWGLKYTEFIAPLIYTVQSHENRLQNHEQRISLIEPILTTVQNHETRIQELERKIVQ